MKIIQEQIVERQAEQAPCCGEGLQMHQPENSIGRAAVAAPWVTGKIETAAGAVPAISTRLGRQDLLGSFKARLGLKRMSYRVDPGLYAVGSPDAHAPVLVSANYKLSFDRLRAVLSNLNAWILVLDTRGINVWCAAGKGTFGSGELAQRVNSVRLNEIVSHNRLILPQLAAPGVSAREVQRLSGFRVVFGPVRAADIPAFLQAGCRSTPVMRTVTFRLADRLAVVPVELAALVRPALMATAALFIWQAIFLAERNLLTLAWRTFFSLLPYLGAILAGTALTAALLPYLPGRPLAWKGWLAGLLWAAVYLVLIAPGTSWLQALGHLLLLPAIAAYLALNFTGSTTYTSLSGVRKEIKYALPAIYASGALGVLGLIAGFLIGGGIPW